MTNKLLSGACLDLHSGDRGVTNKPEGSTLVSTIPAVLVALKLVHFLSFTYILGATIFFGGHDHPKSPRQASGSYHVGNITVLSVDREI